jgi:hypothetical protein
MTTQKSQLDPWIQVYLFQIIDYVFLWNCIKEFFWVNLHYKIYNGPVKNHDIPDGKSFIASYTERGIVIREEIRVGNFSVSNSASKKNCLIMAVWQRQKWWHIKMANLLKSLSCLLRLAKSCLLPFGIHEWYLLISCQKVKLAPLSVLFWSNSEKSQRKAKANASQVSTEKCPPSR